jgi:hypothetical protein
MHDQVTAFPPPPVCGTKRLVPITSWPEMHREVKVTGVEFEEFWHESVCDGVAYFFQWLGEPRGTVLAVFRRIDRVLSVIEAHKINDVPMSPEEALPVLAEVTHVFRAAGYWPGNGSNFKVPPHPGTAMLGSH